MENKECIMYTVEDVQKLLGISRKAAYKLFKQEDFPWMMIGNAKKIIKEDFWAWLQKQKQGRDSA
ncbi:helix-turn-helix domain-containing protein [Pseudoflavonifractor phocaeensis]|uniref:helix-turn-helix domain-containing protein n=1 Tax=Pseudoflavonifractor phocaeensis TaxID=1870988 RepID=UPI00313E67D8